MKRIIAILICVMLLAAPMQALAAQGDILIPQSEDGVLTEELGDFCGIGDTLYMLNSESTKLLTHKVGDTAPMTYSLIPAMEESENGYIQRQIFTDGERLLTVIVNNDYGEDERSADAKLCELLISGDTVEEKVLMDLNWEIFKSEDGYYRYVYNLIGVGEYAIMTSYNDMGFVELYKMNLSGGELVKVDMGDDAYNSSTYIYSINSYIDGLVLIQYYSYEEPTNTQFVTYDPATDAQQEIIKMQIAEYSPLDGIACDQATGKLYYISHGEICELDLESGSKDQAITDMMAEVYNSVHPVVLDGGYFACASYSGYAIRNINPENQAQRRLKVQDNCYAEEATVAYYEFANAHGDVSTVLSREYSDVSIIDAMMNRDGDIDIYLMQASTQQFESVFDRGYVADFRDSEVLMNFANRMSDTLREQLSYNGTLAALPLGVTYWIPHINETALETLGYSLEDVPNSWSEFLDFLMQIQDSMEVNGEITLFDPWTSAEYAHNSLFNAIFNSYQDLLAYDPNAVTKEDMIAILQKLDQIDFARWGQLKQEEMDENYNPEWNNDKILLTVDVGTGLSNIASSINYGAPMVMSLMPNTPAFLPVEFEVAIINPYSENVDLALEFLEKMLAHLDEDTLYSICQDLDEPVKNPYYDMLVQNIKENIEQLEKTLAEAEEIDKQSIQEELDWTKNYLTQVEAEYYWSISEKDIAFIRDNAEYVLVDGSNWLYSDDSGEAYDLVWQYNEGQIDATKLMDAIDRKIRMMLMEGY